jgi:hypothetical protein
MHALPEWEHDCADTQNLLARWCARTLGDQSRGLFLEQQRTAALTERMAQAEGDIEKMQEMIGRIVKAPTVTPYTWKPNANIAWSWNANYEKGIKR